MRTIWRHVRGWPQPGQIGFAVLIGLILAVAVSAVTESSGSARTRAQTTTPTVTTATAPTPPPKTTPTTTPTTGPGRRLVPLTIASPSHEDTYDRDADFGGFADVDGCETTRAVLLIRTSRVRVTFTTASDCTVKTGLWTDPWSGATTRVAHDLQIDHTVPLANAWRSGAWAWTHAQRVAYANDLTDPDHLVAILSSENESKGDGGPDSWKPPRRAAWCRYALAWDHIEAKWHLSATRAEWNALVVMSATC